MHNYHHQPPYPVSLCYTSFQNSYYLFLQSNDVFKQSKGKQQMSTAEKKLLIVFCYYVLVGTINLINFSLSTSRETRKAEAIAQHFACEATGYVPGNCDRALFQQYDDYWWLSCIAYILLGFVPTVNLVFAINFQKKLINCCICKTKQRIDQVNGNYLSSIEEHKSGGFRLAQNSFKH